MRAIHGMLWDKEAKTLWVSGNIDAADGTGGRANGTVQGYQYEGSSKTLQLSRNYTFPVADRLNIEWSGSFAIWWDRPHNIVLVPNKRIVLLPTDLDIRALDLSTGVFDLRGERLAKKYLKSFTPVGDRVHAGVALPRSDIKSISLKS